VEIYFWKIPEKRWDSLGQLGKLWDSALHKKNQGGTQALQRFYGLYADLKATKTPLLNRK